MTYLVVLVIGLVVGLAIGKKAGRAQAVWILGRIHMRANSRAIQSWLDE